METKFSLQDLDQMVYNKMLFFLDPNQYRVDGRSLLGHTIEYRVYKGDDLLGVFKITRKANGIVEYGGNGASNDPALSNSWSNLYYKMLLPFIEQEEQSAASGAGDGQERGKRGNRGNLTKTEKIKAIKEWDDLNPNDSPLLAEWLEKKFGSNPDGSLVVPESTFHGWRKLRPIP